MKFFSLVIFLVVGAGLYYVLFMRPSPEGTPHSTAEAYVKAAMADDTATIDSLCKDEGKRTAQEIAPKIKNLSPNLSSLSFKRMATDPPRVGLTMMIRGQVLTLELLKEEKTWKIVSVGLGGD